MLDSALWILEDGHVELFMNRKCIVHRTENMTENTLAAWTL